MLQEGVQLRKSKYSNTAAFGTLELRDGRISFTLDPVIAGKLGGKFAAGNWRWIEEALGTSGIKERLDAEEAVEVFNVPASGVEVKTGMFVSWTGFELKTSEANWVIDFKRVGLPGPGPSGMGGARAQMKAWKQAIADAAAS
jgi:hypothetical protein